MAAVPIAAGAAGGGISLGGVGAALSGIGAIASIFGDSGGGPSRLQIPPELEEQLLKLSGNFVRDTEAIVEKEMNLMPLLEERVKAIYEASKAGAISPDAIARLNKIDEEISTRFGEEELANIKAGLISKRAQDQAFQLQDQIAKELSSGGEEVDAQTIQDIRQAIRNRVALGSAENKSIDEVRDTLLNEIRQTGSVVERKDPAVERQLQVEEEKLKSQLRAQFGNNFENTTQGRRLLQDFRQRATETKFSVSEALKTNNASRLAQLAPSILNTIESKDQGVSRAIQNLSGISTARAQRIKDLAASIAAPGELSSNITQNRAAQVGAVQGTIRNLREAQQGNLAFQGEALKFLDLPSDVARRALQTRAGAVDLFTKLGQFEFSKESRQGLSSGLVPGFNSRTNLYRTPTTPVEGGAAPVGPNFSGLNQDQMGAIAKLRNTRPGDFIGDQARTLLNQSGLYDRIPGLRTRVYQQGSLERAANLGVNPNAISIEDVLDIVKKYGA